jgi:hypothetical protein
MDQGLGRMLLKLIKVSSSIRQDGKVSGAKAAPPPKTAEDG